MTKSVFKTRTLKQIYDEVRQVYLSDNRPWILGFSGGKDSTCMSQLVWNALSELSAEELQKKIYIISSDTLVESPKIVSRITNTLNNIEDAAKQSHLPVSTNLLRPKTEDTFWVCLLGLGYPAPTTLFRWCTDRLKIRNADRFIQEKVSEYGEAIVLLGTRKDESGSRQQLMNLYEIEGSLLSHHSKFAQTYVYTPLKDFITEDVWNYLLQNKNPWGENNRDLLALYQEADASECPLVVDTSTPSCGGGRFGCWTCTVVEKDKALTSMIESGEDWMEPLAELRAELKETQDPEKRVQVREIKRRHGHVELFSDGSDQHTPGPYTMEFCKQFLEKLLQAQVRVRKEGPDPKMTLIHDDELHEIQRIWRMERGDWQNSVHEIYHKVTGEKLEEIKEDLSGFGNLEQELLQEICTKHDVPPLLVSKLLHAEFESQSMTRHSKIYGKINKYLTEEWREDLDEIIDDLRDERQEKKMTENASN
jgi:DNA sulfur modification protein DndC